MSIQGVVILGLLIAVFVMGVNWPRQPEEDPAARRERQIKQYEDIIYQKRGQR